MSLAERDRSLAKNPEGDAARPALGRLLSLKPLSLDRPGRQSWRACRRRGSTSRSWPRWRARLRCSMFASTTRARGPVAEALEFFAPSLEIVAVPAWDCLPYDRVSPIATSSPGGVDAIRRLTEGGGDGLTEGAGRRPLVVTTVAALLQRLPPLESFAGVLLAWPRGSSWRRRSWSSSWPPRAMPAAGRSPRRGNSPSAAASSISSHRGRRHPSRGFLRR